MHKAVVVELRDMARGFGDIDSGIQRVFSVADEEGNGTEALGRASLWR
jgi:hypothetical protein